MTGPEFATAHGNDSATWTDVDFETEMNLAEIDRYAGQTPTDYQPAA